MLVTRKRCCSVCCPFVLWSRVWLSTISRVCQNSSHLLRTMNVSRGLDIHSCIRQHASQMRLYRTLMEHRHNQQMTFFSTCHCLYSNKSIITDFDNAGHMLLHTGTNTFLSAYCWHVTVFLDSLLAVTFMFKRSLWYVTLATKLWKGKKGKHNYYGKPNTIS